MNKNVGIIDSEKQWILNHLEQIEMERQAAIDYQNSILNNCIWADKGKPIGVANAVEQWGTPMPYTVLESLIRKLPMGDLYAFFDFADVEGFKDRPFKSVYFMGGDTPLLISPYGKTILPEWSTLESKREKVRDYSVKHFNRTDFPKPTGFSWKSGFEYPQGTTLPGWKEIEKCSGENAEDPQARGWRTVFARIVGNFLASPTEVEAVIHKFKNTPDYSRQSWQNHMGRRNDKLGY